MVIDSSIAACWCLPDEFSSVAQDARDYGSKRSFIVPSLFWHEIRNVLIVNERRGRITQEQSTSGLSLISQLLIVIDYFPDDLKILRLAREHRLTAYDASYVELAERKAVPLATLDRRLAAAARAEGVTVLTEP